MELRALSLPPLGANCYLLKLPTRPDGLVIDPGGAADAVVRACRELEMTPAAILLTHGHFDHVGGVRQLAADTDCDVYLCGEDLSLPPQLTAGQLYYTHTYGEGSVLHLAGLDITVLATPGHTPGSVCLLTEDTLFSGDTLFAGSCGRTDLPGGSWSDMQSSLGRLGKLACNLWVLPGHGESTTLLEEQRHNPYMR